MTQWVTPTADELSTTEDLFPIRSEDCNGTLLQGPMVGRQAGRAIVRPAPHQLIRLLDLLGYVDAVPFDRELGEGAVVMHGLDDLVQLGQ